MNLGYSGNLITAEALLEKSTLESQSVVSARAGLRVFPLLGEEEHHLQTPHQLTLLRGLLVTVAASAENSEVFKTVANKAAQEINDIDLRPFKEILYIDAIALSLYSVGAKRDPNKNYPRALYCSSSEIERSRPFADEWREIRDDLENLSTDKEPSQLFDHPLWHTLPPPEVLSNSWAHLKTRWASSSLSFWLDWYQGFLDGKPLDWELQRRVALIPDADWEKGPAHIAEKIEEIRAQFELEQRIAELEQELVAASTVRCGIGGNNPPEPIGDALTISRDLAIIWAPLQDLKSEIEEEEPDPSRLQRIIAALKSALATGLKWCANKGDLVVDTAIKWAVPAAGGGYLAMNPDKLEAVIEAAKKLLETL